MHCDWLDTGCFSMFSSRQRQWLAAGIETFRDFAGLFTLRWHRVCRQRSDRRACQDVASNKEQTRSAAIGRWRRKGLPKTAVLLMLKHSNILWSRLSRRCLLLNIEYWLPAAFPVTDGLQESPNWSARLDVLEYHESFTVFRLCSGVYHWSSL